MLWRQKLSESVVIEEDRDDIDKEKVNVDHHDD